MSAMLNATTIVFVLVMVPTKVSASNEDTDKVLEEDRVLGMVLGLL